MRTWLKFAVLPVVVAAGALPFFISPRAEAVVPESISGTYAGKVAFKYHPLSEENSPLNGADTVDATITLTPSDLFVNLTVHAEGGDQLYTMMGEYGLGRFHASGGGPGGQTVIAGKATGVDGKVKLTFTGLTTGTDFYTELKFVMKEQAAP